MADHPILGEELSSWVNDKSNLVFVYVTLGIDGHFLVPHTNISSHSGDSCHPMLPYLAQGANSAVEDGAVLGQVLGHIKSKDQVPKALEMYQRLRKARGEAIARETFKQVSKSAGSLVYRLEAPANRDIYVQRKDFHMPDGPEQEARDELFLSMLGKEVKGPFPSRWTCPDVQPWLYGYDAFKEVEEAVQKDPF